MDVLSKEIANEIYETTAYEFYVRVYKNGKQVFEEMFPKHFLHFTPNALRVKQWQAFSVRKASHLLGNKPNMITLGDRKPYFKGGYPQGALRDPQTNILVAVHGGDPIKDEATAYCFLQRFAGKEINELFKAFIPETLKEIESIKLVLNPAIAS